MLQVRLSSQVSEEAVASGVGRYCHAGDVGLVVEQDAAIYKPNGDLLLKLRRGAIPEEVRARSHGSLFSLSDRKTFNRSTYGAYERKNVRLADGTLSKTQRSTAGVSSAIIGYMDRMGGRYPYCRATQFTADEVAHWQDVLPLIELADKEFEAQVPDRHKAQLSMVREQVQPQWVVGRTAFTTITVNNTVVAGIHKDKGDYGPGFGVISCFRQGSYTGGLLCFPKFRVAVDLRDRDLLFFDPHEWHGMTPIEALDDEHQRITCVFYAREKMRQCGSLQEEIERARSVRGAIE